MRTVSMLSAVALGIGACTPMPASQRAPYLPAGVYGTYEDNGIGAINQSAWAFSSSANTRGNPIDAARAVVALEYLSGEMRQNPRWVGTADSIKLHLARARDELRQIVGIRPNAPSQIVVNTLLSFAWDLQIGDTQGALAALASPVFTRPPDGTLQVLTNLPYNREANLATARAEASSLASGGGSI